MGKFKRAALATAVLTSTMAASAKADWCTIEVWNDKDFGGCAGHERFYESASNFSDLAFRPTRCYLPRKMNDRVSSFIVRSGEWRVCLDADYKSCLPGTYGPGDRVKNMDRVKVRGKWEDLNDKISSLQLVSCHRGNGASRNAPSDDLVVGGTSALPNGAAVSWSWSF